MNFWKQLKKPIICLAPMADVTDASFRRVIAKYSKVEGGTPFVTWTEFVSADGLIRATPEGKKKLLKDLEYSEEERPIVAQLFSGKPEMMEQAAYLVASFGFDGLDINMGCPDKGVEKQGAGASLIKDPARAREIIRAAKQGTARFAEEHNTSAIPVSVKTRIGYNKDELEEWLPELLAEAPAVITLHARTRKEMSKVPARWERVKRAVEIRDTLKSETLIFGNGDVDDVSHAYKLVEETGCDGAMLGRAIFGNPFLFSNRIPTFPEKLNALVEHSKLFDTLLGDVKHFAIMKKHFKSYLSPRGGLSSSGDLSSFPHITNLKNALLAAESSSQVEELVEDFFRIY